jgi:hypothetical protein
MDLPEPPRPDQRAYPPAPEAPAPPGPGSKWKPSAGFIVAMVIVGLVVLGAIINAFDGESSSGDGDAPSSSVVVTYVVSGDSNQADVTYQNRNGGHVSGIGGLAALGVRLRHDTRNVRLHLRATRRLTGRHHLFHRDRRPGG